MARFQGPDAAAFNCREQSTTRPGNTAHDRSDGNIQQFRGLAVAETGYVDQGDNFAMRRGEHGETLLHGDFGDTGVVKAPKIDCGDVVSDRLSLATELIERGISDDTEHPGPISRRIHRDLTRGKCPRHRLLHEITGSVSIAQHSAGKCVKPREQCGKTVVLRVRHVKPWSRWFA